MPGASVYLSQDTENILSYLDLMKRYGFNTIFTSFHIAEENIEDLKRKISIVAGRTKVNGQDLMLDISTDALKRFNMDLDEMTEYLKRMNVRKLRLDYGFTTDEIKRISENFDLVLNASTIDDAYCKELEVKGLNLRNITVCHNFYPRPETGLPEYFLKNINSYFKEKGFKVQAFIPGDKDKRGPLKEGLPTIENHRNMPLIYSYIDLKENLLVDEVLIGDISALEESLNRILLFERERLIELKTEKMMNLPEEISDIIYGIQQNRKDYSELVLRSTMTRVNIKTEIEPMHTFERRKGAITLDNKNYGRYAGELQIALKDLPKDDKVNVIGQIASEDIPLLPFIKNDIKFRFIKK